MQYNSGTRPQYPPLIEVMYLWCHPRRSARRVGLVPSRGRPEGDRTCWRTGGGLDASMLDLSLGHFALLNHSSFQGSTLFFGYVSFFMIPHHRMVYQVDSYSACLFLAHLKGWHARTLVLDVAFCDDMRSCVCLLQGKQASSYWNFW